jgi:hypothetical protein
MGRLFICYLEGRVYSCKACKAHLAKVDELVSKVRDPCWVWGEGFRAQGLGHGRRRARPTFPKPAKLRALHEKFSVFTTNMACQE